MTRSDWIALVAAIGTLLGLIPSYKLYFTSKRPKDARRGAKGNAVKTGETATDKDKQEEPMSAFMKATVLVALAFLIFVIELFVYSAAAYALHVKIDLSTMPVTWGVAFYSLFAVPGLLCFLAFINIMGTMGP